MAKLEARFQLRQILKNIREETLNQCIEFSQGYSEIIWRNVRVRKEIAFHRRTQI